MYQFLIKRGPLHLWSHCLLLHTLFRAQLRLVQSLSLVTHNKVSFAANLLSNNYPSQCFQCPSWHILCKQSKPHLTLSCVTGHFTWARTVSFITKAKRNTSKWGCENFRLSSPLNTLLWIPHLYTRHSVYIFIQYMSLHRNNATQGFFSNIYFFTCKL